MKVADIMSRHVIYADQKEPVTAAARLMKRHNLGALPVCDGEGRLRGLVTDRDIVTRCVAMDYDPADTMLREIMSRGILTCAPGDEADSAAAAMGREQIRRIPVTEDGKLVGMVSLADMARQERLGMEAAAALTHISANLRRG